MNTTIPKTRTITLTDHAPVRIREYLWPVLAAARGDSYAGHDMDEHRLMSSRGELDEYFLTVRRHAVSGEWYGVYARLNAGIGTTTRDRAEDVLLHSSVEQSSESLPATIRQVGEHCGIPDRIIADCIAALPPIDLDVVAS